MSICCLTMSYKVLQHLTTSYKMWHLWAGCFRCFEPNWVWYSLCRAGSGELWTFNGKALMLRTCQVVYNIDHIRPLHYTLTLYWNSNLVMNNIHHFGLYNTLNSMHDSDIWLKVRQLRIAQIFFVPQFTIPKRHCATLHGIDRHYRLWRRTQEWLGLISCSAPRHDKQMAGTKLRWIWNRFNEVVHSTLATFVGPHVWYF